MEATARRWPRRQAMARLWDYGRTSTVVLNTARPPIYGGPRRRAHSARLTAVAAGGADSDADTAVAECRAHARTYKDAAECSAWTSQAGGGGGLGRWT